MPDGSKGWAAGQFLKFWVDLMVKPESAAKFEQAIRYMELPITIGASDLKAENNDIGSFIITRATHIPDWADETGEVDSMMIFSDVNIPIFLEKIKKNPLMGVGAAADKMFGVSIPDAAFGSDGVVPVNMAALNQYQETGSVTLEVHQGGDVFEVDLIKDPNTGRPVAYPKIPL
jgi:hypothetical protein